MEKSNEILKPSQVMGLSITIYIVATLLGTFLAMALTSYMENGADLGYNISLIAAAVIAVPVMCRLLRNGRLWRFRECPWKTAAGYAALGLLLICMMDTAMEYIFLIFDLYQHDAVRKLYEANALGMEGGLLLQILGSAVAPAITEELLFRGAIFWVIRQKKGFLFSAAISSLIFGILHGIGLYTLIGFLAGMVFCLVLEITQSLIVPIAVHFFNNLLATLAVMADAGYADPQAADIYEFESGAMNIVMLLLLLGGSAIITVILLKKAFREKPASR